jgi:uncharacterized protein YcbX
MSELRVAGIYRYPVKSMQGEGLAAGTLTERGLPGDRGWAVLDVDTGKVLSGKREPRLMEAVAFTSGESVRVRLPEGELLEPGSDADAALSEWLGRAVVLRQPVAGAGYQMHVDPIDDSSPIIDLPCPPDTFFDAAAVHLITNASLRAMAARRPDSTWDVHRFRPTLLVEGGGDAFLEDAWIGETVAVGDAELMVFAPTVRCRMTGHAQPGLEVDREITRGVVQEHEGNLGVYAIVRTPGRVALGDLVTAG